MDPILIARQWVRQGKRVAFATVVSTWGSAPRPAGSRLVVDEQGNFEGSVSGGCVEVEVIAEAIDAIGTAKHRVLQYGVADDVAWKAGLPCGGRIEVLVHLVSNDEILRMASAIDERKLIVEVIDLSSGLQVVHANDCPQGEIAELIRETVTVAQARVFDRPHTRLLIIPSFPPARIVVFGATHIAQALVRAADIVGMQAIVVDPREAFATAARFPDVEVLPMWPDEIMELLSVDPETAIVAVTHESRIDDLAIELGLQSGCFYVGALGGRKTRERRSERLHERGLQPGEIAKVKSPIGLDIGARKPSEIAIAILAEIIAARRERR